jgi:hypothetical protein
VFLGALSEYASLIKLYNTEKTDGIIKQRLDGREEDSWKSFEDLEANLSALRHEEEKQPGNYKFHLFYLIYALALMLKDVCVFRRELLVETVICGPHETDMHGICLVFDAFRSAAYFVFNDFKTSASLGKVTVAVPSVLSAILSNSVSSFPRRFLFTQLRDFTKKFSPSKMSSFVRDAWILDDRAGPTPDNLRSAVATRFFNLHPDIVSREEFARKSCVSRSTLEANYYKPFT